MPNQCRLCGLTKHPSEFVITLQNQSDNVSFLNLVEYFCRITLDNDLRLPQAVCKKCKVSLQNFMYFCDAIERHQIYLKESSILKSEIERQSSCVVVQEPETQTIIKSNNQLQAYDRDDLFDVSNSEIADKDSGSTSSSTLLSTGEAGNYFNLRSLSPTPPPFELKQCSVVLERLDIIFVPSDTESDEEEEASATPLESPEKSPFSKRMRIQSPMKKNSMQENNQETASTVVTQRERAELGDCFESYRGLFDSEFSTEYVNSKFNLNIAQAAQNKSDGSVYDDYCDKFVFWSSFELKCLNKQCNLKFRSPYELMVHNENTKHAPNNNFYSCSICTATQLLTYSQYYQHVTSRHHNHLKYCCMCCSKMHFNFAALFRHYVTEHAEYPHINMCLNDGLLFDNFELLKDHVAMHESSKSFRLLKTEKTEKKAINAVTMINGSGMSGSISSASFTAVSSTRRKFSCDKCERKFDSNYNLIIHECKTHRKNGNSKFA